MYSELQKLETEICRRSSKSSDRIVASNHLQELIKLKQVDLMSCTTLLKSMMSNLSPDSGRRLAGGDESSYKLELHIIALQIIKSAVQVDCQKLLTANILTNGNVGHLFDLLDLSSAHLYCCYKAATVTWSEEQIKVAKEVLEGKIVEAKITLSDQKSHLTEEMYTTSIILSNGVRVSDEFIKRGISSLAHFREEDGGRIISCKVCQVISPQYVWLQPVEEKPELVRLSSKLSQRTVLNRADKTDKRVLIRLPQSSVSFRGDILKWEGDQVSILATDYGWTTDLSESLLYKLELDELDVSPGAILCNISGVSVITPQIKIQQLALSTLQHVAKIRNWSDIVFASDRNKILLDILKTSNDPEIVSTIVTIQSLLVNNGLRGNGILESIMKVSSRFMNCKSIMICATQYFRNYVVRNDESMFVKRKGLELMFTVLKNHPEDERIRNHCQIVFSKCFKGTEFESNKEEPCQQPSSSLYTAPQKSFRFHHQYNMGTPNRRRAFINKLATKEHERKLSLEIASLLNTEGGEIYVGVDEGAENSGKTGDIIGLKVDRRMRDKYNLFVDDVITDEKFMVHVTSSYDKLKISQNFVTSNFERIDNTYESVLQSGFDLMLFIVTVKPLTHGLCQGRNVFGKSVYYCRDESGIVEMHVNEIRQKLVAVA